MKLKCLVVDDEPIARQILENYISNVPNLTLAGACKNAFEVIDFLQTNSVDIMFLDINMPKLSGLNLIRTMKITPNVIITSAYSEYALDGFELSVVDYLLKPFSFERFLKAVMKIPNKKEFVEPTKAKEQIVKDFIFVKTENRQIKLTFEDINYIEAYGNYIKIHAEKIILVPQTLSDFLNKLPSQFVRNHKSFIFNFNNLKLIEGNQLMLTNEIRLPIGRFYKKNIVDRINE